MKSLFFALACSLALAACAGLAPATAPALDVQTVKATVAVPVPCIDPSNVPMHDDFLTDGDLLSGSGSQVIDKLWRDHIQRRDYIGQLEPIVVQCSKINSPTPLAEPAGPK